MKCRRRWGAPARTCSISAAPCSLSCRRGAELGQRRGQRGPPRASSIDPDPTEIGFPPAARKAPSSREDRYASDRGRISQAGRERGSAERLDSTTRVCGESRGDSVHVDHGNLTRYVRPFANPAPQITHGDPGGDTILFPDPVPPGHHRLLADRRNEEQCDSCARTTREPGAALLSATLRRRSPRSPAIHSFASRPIA